MVIQLPKICHSHNRWTKYKYGQQEKVTVRNHDRRTALERSVLNYWEGGRGGRGGGAQTRFIGSQPRPMLVMAKKHIVSCSVRVRAGCGIGLYRFLIIAYLFTSNLSMGHHWKQMNHRYILWWNRDSDSTETTCCDRHLEIPEVSNMCKLHVWAAFRFGGKSPELTRRIYSTNHIS